MSDTEHLQHSKLNCTVQWTMIASGLPTFKKIVCWNYLLNFTLRRILIFLIFKIVLGPMSDTELLQQSKLNCTMLWTMIASGLPKFMAIVCGIIFNFTLRRLLIYFLIYKIVLGLMSDKELLQHSKLNGTE